MGQVIQYRARAGLPRCGSGLEDDESAADMAIVKIWLSGVCVGIAATLCACSPLILSALW